MDEKNLSYSHTQIGHLMIFVLAAVAALYAFILSKAGFNPAILGIMALILLILASFTTLKAEIGQTHLKIKFGYGIFRKKFPLKEIASAKAVKNRWYFGWGIRYWLFPKMWVFNVSGFDAVEIKMRNSRIYRIGTDDQKNLEAALVQAMK
ncbi:hypothetical protein J4212_00070 [Candidatus Woesearchaeota archaeon]|nr:hypothetical protein [Candidatus Woesearchaeota archaeon]